MKIVLFFLLLSLVLGPDLFAKGDLDANGVSVNDRNPDPGDLVTVRWTALNRTGDYIGGSQQGVMFSSNSSIRHGDTLLAREYVGPLGGFYADSSPETKVVKIPTWAVPGRTYWIGIYADYDYDRSESNESNNYSSGVSITIRAGDLYASNLSINDSNPDLGDLVTVSWTANARNDIPVSSTQQGVMLSTDNVISKSDTFLEFEPLGALGGVAFASSPELRTITIPENLTPGDTYYLGVIMDYNSQVTESNEGNNASVAGSFTPRGPDLEAVDLAATTIVFTEKSESITTWPGDSLFLEWEASNSGDGASALFDFSQQAVRWSTDPVVDRNDRILEREPLGILLAGATSRELRTVEIPSDVEFGETYYIAVEADTDREFRESDEANNFSNVIEIHITSPISTSSFNVSDYNYLPYLEGDGLEFNDPRMRDSDGDGKEDAGATMNPSRCFAPGDLAYINLDADLTLSYTLDFNPFANVRLTAWWNTSATLTGKTKIGSMILDTGVLGETLNLPWNLPDTPGEYYVYVTAEVQIEGVWYEFREEWIDDGGPMVVSEDLPVILVHGWSDDKGKTFGDLEIMIETLWQRPVRAFGYETDNTYDVITGTGTGDGPRVDLPYTEINGEMEMKPSLAEQMEQFLAGPEGDGRSIDRCDVVAHSMGGLVSRNYILRENKVRRFITVGTPSYGGLFAAEGDGLLNNQAEDLEFGATVTWKLHREWGAPENRAELPRCLTIIGTNDHAPGQYNQSDVVVPCNSASLESLGFPAYYVPLGHSPAFSPSGSGAIAFIDDVMHPSWPAIEAFLNSDSGIVPVGLPGHFGGADDVGHKNHPEALENGALYIVSVDGEGNAQQITSVDLGHVPSGLLIESNGIHEGGVFYANLVGATGDSVGSRSYTEAESDVFLAGSDFQNQLIRVYAGETAVLAINGNDHIYSPGDVDSDGLPDSIEDLIIAADPDDGITELSQVSADTDFDGDLIPELLEAALGTDPTQPEFGLPSIEIVDGMVVVRHPNVSPLFDLEISCETASSPGALADWSREGISGKVTLRNVREWRTPHASGAQFFRIRAHAPGE